MKSSHIPGEHELQLPPQSTPVSVPFCIPSLQVGVPHPFVVSDAIVDHELSLH